MASSASRMNQSEKTDKFGYASLMVGDSAALFTRYMEEYGTDYGLAARAVGQAFDQANNGSISTAMVASQRFLDACYNALPIIMLSAFAVVSSNIMVAATLRQHGKEIRRIRHEKREQTTADRLLQSTQSDYVTNIIDTASLYGRDEKAKTVYLILPDSYLAAQCRRALTMLPEEKVNGIKEESMPVIKIFDNLQEALDALSMFCSIKSIHNSKTLLYFHTFETFRLNETLEIKKCNNFILRSDYGCHTGSFQPRLILTGKLRVSQSTGTLHSVAIPNSNIVEYNDKQSQIRMTKCVFTPQKEDYKPMHTNLFLKSFAACIAAVVLCVVPPILTVMTSERQRMDRNK